MNKNRLMAAGSLLAIGAMLPITTGALTAAKTPPEPVVTATATASPSATPTAAPTPDCANLQPGDAWAGVSLHCGLEAPTPTPTATSTAVAVEPGTVPAPEQTAPACPEPTVMAEDGSCVNPHFWDEPAPIQEDDPAWDCLTMGNKLCGVDPAKLGDAWASFDAEAVAAVVGKSVSFGAAYVGTSAASSLPAYWVVPSLQYPNTFHVFTINVGE